MRSATARVVRDQATAGWVLLNLHPAASWPKMPGRPTKQKNLAGCMENGTELCVEQMQLCNVLYWLNQPTK